MTVGIRLSCGKRIGNDVGTHACGSSFERQEAEPCVFHGSVGGKQVLDSGRELGLMSIETTVSILNVSTPWIMISTAFEFERAEIAAVKIELRTIIEGHQFKVRKDATNLLGHW